MTVAVVSVAYGAPDLLEQALIPLVDWFPVFVIDNSSDDRVRTVVEALGARYEDPGENLGFGRGVNRAVALARATLGPVDVLVLNPDACMSPEGVERLHAAALADERLAAVSPALQTLAGAQQRVLWPFPSPRRMWLEALGLGRINDAHAEWVVGAVLLLTARAWDDVGEFDPRFFLYQEETDWQRRAVACGWRVTVVDAVVARHVGGGTSSDSRRRDTLAHAGVETYVRKWFGSSGWASYRAAALTGALLRSWLPGRRGAAARHRVALYVRGPRRVAAVP